MANEPQNIYDLLHQGDNTPRRTQPREEDDSFLPPSTSASGLDLSGVLAAKLHETAKYEAGAAAAKQYREDTSVTPRYTTGDIWSDSVKAGGEQLTADVYQFGALWNLVRGDEEAATAKLNRAERLQQDASFLLNSMGTFEGFLEEPTFEGFFDQVVKSIGQFTPMAISSVGSGFTGAAVAAVGKGVLTATSKKVTREVISDILKKKVAHRKGLGEALDETEEAILGSAYESVKRMGQYPNFLNVAKTGKVPSNFPFIEAGFWAGAGGQEYVVGSSQALGEYKEAGYKLTAEEAKAAYGLGIPQAIIGTLGEKLFVGAMFKRMAGRVAKTGDKEAAGWMMEAARGFGSGLVRGGVVEGTTETLQEELFIQQRFGIDPEYSEREANLRRAESAFAGFWAGAGRSAPTGAVAGVIGKARTIAQEGADLTEEFSIVAKKGLTGRVIPEPKDWSQAQVETLLDEETDTKAVWLPTDGLDKTEAANVINDFLGDLTKSKENPEGYTPAEIQEKFAFIPDPNGSGVLILNKANKTFDTDAKDAIDSGFSETFLQQILGYTEVSDPSHDAVVQVKNAEGNVVWQQTTSEANVDRVKLHARTRFKNDSKYSIEGVTREAAFNERQQAFKGKGFGFTDTQETTTEATAPEQGEMDFDAPQQGEFDFTERSMETTGQQEGPAGIKSPLDPTISITQGEADKFSKAGGVVEVAKEGFITKTLNKAAQAKMTEQEVIEAKAKQPAMTWTPREPNELTEATPEEVNTELDKREKLISGEKGFLEINEIEESAGITALLDTLPTAFLETFKAQARLNPNLILTPQQNENGEWTIATSPKDVLPGDRINAAERIDDVVTKASRAPQATRNKTPGWSVRRAGQNDAGRAVYMGNLVQLGLDLGINDPQAFTEDTGRIVDGFTRTYEALVENGYELLYEGQPINDPNITLRPKAALDGEGQQQLVSLGFDSQSFIEARTEANIVAETESPVHREGTESGRNRVGQHKWAYRDRNGVIHINEKILEQKFKDKAWTKSLVEGVRPLPEDAFSTLAEFREFIILHEVGHGLVRRVEGAPGGPAEFNEAYGTHENRINDAALIIARSTTPPEGRRADVQAAAWQNAPMYQLKGGRPISFNEAEQGRAEIQDPDAPTDAQLQQELDAIEAKLQTAFEEFYADPNRDPKAKFYPPDALSQVEMDRKFQLERQLNKGFVDKADFVDTVKGTEGEFTPKKPNLDDPNHGPILSGLELEAQTLKFDHLGPPKKVPSPGKKGKVTIDASWSSVLGGLWPQLSSILTSRLGYGGRSTQIITKQAILENGFKSKETFTQGGQEYSIAELINESVANMDSLGKYFRFNDADLIVIDVPANPTIDQQVKSILALGHEIGHAMFHQETERALNNPKLRKDLIAAWEKDRDAGVSEQYKGEFGYEEWYADQMGTWLLAEAKKPTNAVESFFYRLANKIRAVFRSLDANLRQRFSRNEAFDPYVQDIIKSYRDRRSINTGMPTPDKVIVRNMVDELAVKVKEFMPKKALQQLKRKAIDVLSVPDEGYKANDRRHWSVAYFLQPAATYLRGLGASEIANVFTSRSQSEEKSGHLNTRVLLMYQRLNDLWKLAPTKKTVTGKIVPDLEAFEPILREAEKNVPMEELSPKAQQARQYLNDFYENYIRGVDEDIGKRENFYPRIIALAEIQANPEIQAKLVELLKEKNPDGPDDIVLYNTKGEEMSRTPGSFEKVVAALISEGQDNTDNPIPEVGDVAIGMNESRTKYFKEISNEELRDIGALTDAGTAIRRYVEDTTKRLDYLDKSQTEVTKKDLDNIKNRSKAMQTAFGKVKAGDTVKGWRAMEVMLERIPDPKNRAAARDAVKAMLGKMGLGMSPVMRNINSALLSLNIMTYLTFATLASLPDLAGPVLRSKDLSWENLGEGLKQVRRYFTETQEMQQFARDVGVITFDSINTSIMQSSELGFMTPAAQKGSDMFFRAIGLEWYTNFTRVFAAGMGEQFLIRQANLNTERSSRFLKELEVSREDIRAWDQNGRSFDTPEGQRVQMALGRFVEESIIRPNAAERPVWASNPYTALVWQLKSFFYAYGINVVGGAMRESKNRYAEDGTLSSASIPLVLGALTILPLTMVGLEIREWLKYLGRGGDPKAFRSDNMKGGEYSMDIIDRAGILGPFGLALPLLESGKYGKSGITPLFGPTAERLEDLIRGNARLYDYIPGYASIR